MTAPNDAPPAAVDKAANFPFRIASTLSWIVGVFTLLGAVAVNVPALDGSVATAIPLVTGIAVGLAVCGAAFLVRRRNKIGAYLIVAACVVPTLWILVATGQFKPPSLLILLATITVLANWKQFR